MTNPEASELIIKGHLTGIQRSHLARLLNMYYSPQELSEIIGFSLRQIYRVYVPLGCPCQRDHRRYLWINGRQFREWYLKTYPNRSLAPDEAFCLTCRKPVKMRNPVHKTSGKITYLLCACDSCGRRLARILSQQRAA